MNIITPGVYVNMEGPDGPLADRVRASLLEGHSSTTTGRAQGQEENVQAIPRPERQTSLAASAVAGALDQILERPLSSELMAEAANILSEAIDQIHARITPPLGRRVHTPREMTLAELRMAQAGIDGPLADQARSALEGHSGTMTGRFQGQVENVQAIPREITPEVARRLIEAEQTIQARITPPLARRAHAPLRGQMEHAVMIDDAWYPPEMPVEEKAQKCRDLAEFICQDIRWENKEEVINETAIDLMPIPAMNLERIHKRLQLDVVNACVKILEGLEKDPPPKPLTRFQILKRK